MGMTWMSTRRVRTEKRRDRKDHSAEERRKEATGGHFCENLTMPRGNSRAGRRSAAPTVPATLKDMVGPVFSQAGGDETSHLMRDGVIWVR